MTLLIFLFSKTPYLATIYVRTIVLMSVSQERAQSEMAGLFCYPATRRQAFSDTSIYRCVIAIDE